MRPTWRWRPQVAYGTPPYPPTVIVAAPPPPKSKGGGGGGIDTTIAIGATAGAIGLFAIVSLVFYVKFVRKSKAVRAPLQPKGHQRYMGEFM